jgi:hypothetical protein
MKKINLTIMGMALTGLLAGNPAGAWTTISPVDFNAQSSAIMNIRSKSFSDEAFGHQAWAMHGKWGVLNAVKGKSYTIMVDGSANAGLHPAVALWKRPIGTPEQPYRYFDGSAWVEVTNLTPAKNVPDHNFFPVQSYINSGKSQQHVMESGGGSGGPTVSRTINGTTIEAPTSAFWKAALRPGAEVTANTGVLLEDGQTDIGMARMLFVGAAYDADGASKIWNVLNVNPALMQQKDGVPGKVSLKFTADETAQYEFFVGGMNPDNGHAVGWYNVNVSIPKPQIGAGITN